MDQSDVTTVSYSELQEALDRAESRWAVTVAWALISSIGLLTNTCNIMVFARYRITSLVLYLRALSVFDFIFCFAVICITVYNHVGYATYPMIVLYLYIAFPVNLLFSAMGTYTILIISVERAFGVLYPFVAQRKLSLKVSKVTLAITMVVLTAVRLPIVVLSFDAREVAPGYYAQRANAFFKSRLGLTLWVVMGMVFEFIPFIILVISNCIVMRSVWKLKKNMSKLTSEAATMDPKVSMMLIGIVIMFLICEVPLTVTRIITIPAHIFTVVEPLTAAMVFLNRSANMFIYLATSSEYRHHLRASFGCGQGQVEPWNQNTTSGAATNVTQIRMKDTATNPD